MTWSVLVPIGLTALGLMYLAIFGQQSVAEWRRNRGARSGRESMSTGPIENLPTPDFQAFLGRDTEVSKLLQLLRPYPFSQHSVVAIDGVGGAGKSALALFVAEHFVRSYRELPESERFDAVIWTSAKPEFLTADGPRARPLRHRNLDDIFDTIAACLGREDITRAAPEHKGDLVGNSLKRQRTLLVVDNLETIDDEGVISFLRELPAPTKAIVTTRYRIDVAMNLTLGGLSEEGAASLLEVQFAEFLPDMTSAEKSRLIELTGRLPLGMVWCAARLRLGESLADILESLSAGSDALASYSFDAIWRQLQGDPTARDALQAMACLPHSASLLLIAGTAEIADLRQARQAVNSLGRLCLVTQDRDTWTIHPLVRTFTLGHRDDMDRFLVRAAVWLASRLRELIGDERVQAISVVQYASVDPDRANLVFIVDWCFARGRWADVKTLVAGMGYFLHARGHWADAVRTWESGSIAARECGDSALESRFLTYLGYMAYFMGNPPRAEFYYEQASRLVPPEPDSYQRGSLSRLSGYLHLAENNLGEALRDFRQGLVAMRTCQNTHGICRLLNDIAEACTIMGDQPAAEAAAQEALARAESAGELIERVRSIRVLAVRARMLGDHRMAWTYAVESRAQALECGWWDDAGKATLELALASSASGRNVEAARLAEEAASYFDRIGSRPGLDQCQRLIANLPRQRR